MKAYSRQKLPDSAFAYADENCRLFPHHKPDGTLSLPHLNRGLIQIALIEDRLKPDEKQLLDMIKLHLMTHLKEDK